MTKVKILTFMSILLWANWSGAASPLCSASLQSKQTCGKEKSIQELGTLSKIEHQIWLKSESELIQDIYRQKKDQFANMFRLIENGKLDDHKLEPEIQREINSTLEDVEILFYLSQTIKSLNAKLQLCYQGLCGPQRRVELEEQLVIIQRSKSYLLIKRPLLTHPVFEEWLQKSGDTFPEKESLKKLISTASRETAATLLDKVDGYSRLLSGDLKNIPDSIADDLLNHFEISGPPAGKESWLCQLAIKREKDRERDAILKKGIETSLFVAPFILGPWGRFGAFGLEGIIGARLLRFGMTVAEIEKAAWLTRASVGITSNMAQSYEVKNIGESCKSIEQKFMLNPDEKKFGDLNRCKTDYDDAVFVSTLGWITAFAPEIPGSALKFYKAKFSPQLIKTTAVANTIGTQLQKSPMPKNQWAKEFQTTDQGHFTYMDLSKIERVADHQMRQVPDDYWKFVGNIYSERLNLTPEEIKGFIKSSQEFSPRTKLIINTNNSVKDAKSFNGGVGIVVSDKPQDLLPLEKAIGKNLGRSPSGKVAEIVRLTVAKDADAEKLSKSLINQAAGVILQDPEIKTVYVYTSKIHGRLYKRLGVSAESIVSQGDRDIVIALSRSEIEKLLAKTR